MSWTCGQCNAVWAPWFAGPCPHPIRYVDSTDTSPPSHDHEYAGYETTAGPTCVVCGRRPPEVPNFTMTHAGWGSIDDVAGIEIRE